MRPITDVLIEFPREPVPDGLLDGVGALDLDLDPDIEPAAPPPPDPEVLAAERASGFAAGLAEGRAQAEEAWTAKFAAMGDEVEAERAADRVRWAAEEGATLADLLRAGLQRLEETLAGSLAAALMPLVNAALRQRAAAELGTAVERLLTGMQGAVIEVSGPADLLAGVREAYADNPAVLCREADISEARIQAGDSTVVSQVELWSSRLLELFGEAA